MDFTQMSVKDIWFSANALVAMIVAYVIPDNELRVILLAASFLVFSVAYRLAGRPGEVMNDG